MIAAMQFQREEVYIANVVKCRPPGSGFVPDEAAACIWPQTADRTDPPRSHCAPRRNRRQLPARQARGITRLRGKWLGYDGIPVMPTFTAFLLRQGVGKRTTLGPTSSQS